MTIDRRSHADTGTDGTRPPRELVLCSLEPWDDVWRRNQFLAEELLRRDSELRILFVEPPTDMLFDLRHLRRPARPYGRELRADGRLHAYRPLKPLPRRLGPLSDNWLCSSVVAATARLRFTRPTLWLNDVTYAPLIRRTGWPSIYDVTDDWLLAPFGARELLRLGELDMLALEQADEVVVCSPALAATRGAARPVTLVPNGVDHEHFRRAQQRPSDLPAGPTAVYVGTLHDARLDVDLVTDLARSLRWLTVVLIGPNSLTNASCRRLQNEPNITLLGPRPYPEVPAYLQHADLVVVPHLVTPFTNSLDPIKAYECLAVRTPALATPVAGFRDLAQYITIASRETFVQTAIAIMENPIPTRELEGTAVSWAERARAFELVLTRAADSSTQSPTN